MQAAIDAIYRYPVKGLNGESLEKVQLEAGATLPGDRRFAIAHGSTRFDSAAPAWQSKQNFLMLAKNERLAQLEASFDSDSGVLTLHRAGKQVARGNISDIMGRTLICQFLAGFLMSEARGTPKLVEGRDFAFTDVPDRVISLINLASVADLERVVREPVAPLRFRGNVYLSGLSAWAERQWVGREIQLGALRIRITGEIERCAATNVNPETAERDMNLPLTLRKGFRHMKMGVYAEVLDDGEVRRGDGVTPA